MHRGFIKLWRKTEDSFLMKNSEAFHLFFSLVLKANHEDSEHMFNYQKITIKRGQLITGRHSLSLSTGIQESKIFRLLKCLESEHLIEQQKTNRYTVITIVCYNDYQSNEQQNEQQMNNKRTTDEQQMNTVKELIRTNKNINSVLKAPTIEEVSAYCLERGSPVDPEAFWAYYDAREWKFNSGKPVKKWKSCIVTWEKNDLVGGKKLNKTTAPSLC